VARFTALIDASVLYSVKTSDLVLETAREGIFRARWSDAIHDEWTRRLAENRPDLDPQRIAKRRDAMNRAIPDCLVSGYQHLIDGVNLPDENDRHVLAAAIAGRADVIVTHNIKDFPATELDRFGIEAQDPDTFLVHQRGLNNQLFLQCVRRILRRMTNPPVSVEDYLAGLRKVGLIVLASELEEAKSLLRPD
jgi:predicted nucleic acid-binding protein